MAATVAPQLQSRPLWRLDSGPAPQSLRMGTVDEVPDLSRSPRQRSLSQTRVHHCRCFQPQLPALCPPAPLVSCYSRHRHWLSPGQKSAVKPLVSSWEAAAAGRRKETRTGGVQCARAGTGLERWGRSVGGAAALRRCDVHRQYCFESSTDSAVGGLGKQQRQLRQTIASLFQLTPASWLGSCLPASAPQGLFVPVKWPWKISNYRRPPLPPPTPDTRFLFPIL